MNKENLLALVVWFLSPILIVGQIIGFVIYLTNKDRTIKEWLINSITFAIILILASIIISILSAIPIIGGLLILLINLYLLIIYLCGFIYAYNGEELNCPIFNEIRNFVAKLFENL